MKNLVTNSNVAQKYSHSSRTRMCGHAVLISTLLMVIGLGSSIANADNHGICFSHDYDDNGERYCDEFHTMEDIRQRHIRLREFCKEKKNISRCEPIQYIRDGGRHFYLAIKTCSDEYGEKGKSRFFVLTDAGLEFEGKEDVMIVAREKNHSGSCLENGNLFDEYAQKDPTYFYSQNGVLKYGGIMPK